MTSGIHTSKLSSRHTSLVLQPAAAVAYVEDRKPLLACFSHCSLPFLCGFIHKPTGAISHSFFRIYNNGCSYKSTLMKCGAFYVCLQERSLMLELQWPCCLRVVGGK